ncbi:dna topoisomerase 2 [Quercus suber]|uniref:DNA topoisomerase (ATP-hydrolyzing) n=1 Tax=Quercus suber TaxID=58331 RepID=A0AAW0JHQ0_QUESU
MEVINTATPENLTSIAATSTSSSSSTLAASLFIPLSKLKSMSIYHMKKTLPKELMCNLISLQDLEIENCCGPLPLFRHLTALQNLTVRDSKEVDLTNDGDEMEWHGLQSLRALWFLDLPNLATLPVGIQHLTSLQRLYIARCPSLSAIPEWICNLTSLQKLGIWECPILSKRCKREAGEDRNEEPTLTIWSLIKPFGRCNCSTIQQIHRVKDQWYKMISSNIVRRIKSSSHSAGTSMLCRRMKHEAMQNIGEVDSPLIFVPLPVRISQRFVDIGNSSVSHLTTKMQKEPVISKCKESENWTKVSFKPDLAKFNMTHLEDDVAALMKKRVFDLAGCLGKSVKVELNGTRVPVKSFTDYVNLYLDSAAKSKPEKLPSLLSWANFKQSKDLKKSDGTKTEKIHGIEKLDDANKAGGKESDKCTLILTEGDLAKALALAGLAVVGRDHYGVFLLRGKLLNVREATAKQLPENKEIGYIKQILGLQQHEEYNNVKSLRYGHLMIITDQGLGTSTSKEGREYFAKLPSFLVMCLSIQLIITGGKDHASARYVYTRLSPITRFLFHKDDDDLLDYLNEGGQSIDPTWYMPIIPMVLVNGSEGIGTGWSSYVPNYNPRDIIANIRCLLNGDTMDPMDPWYKWFKGTIEKTAAKEGGNSYTICGTIEEDFDMNCDDVTVEFDIFLTPENLIRVTQKGLLKKFKLTTTISTTNMHLFDLKGVIKKYDNPEQILEEFFHLRLEFYEKRKKFLLNKREMELLKLENKVRFILAVVKGEIVVSNRKRADLFVELQTKGFTPFPKKTKAVEPEVAGATDDTEETEVKSPADSSSNGVQISDYEYLLAMAIGSLTIEKVQELCAERDKLNKEVDDLRKETPKSFWRKDLDALDGQLDELEKSDAQSEELRKKMRGKARGEAAMKSTRQAPKNPRKNNNRRQIMQNLLQKLSRHLWLQWKLVKKAPEVAKPKGRAGSRKVPAKVNFSLFLCPTAMETEVPKVPAKKKEPSKRAAAAQKKKPLATVSEISDDDINEINDDDEDSEIEVVAAPEARKKGRRNRLQMLRQLRSLQRQRREVQPISSSLRHLRRMRASPFNKKSGCVLGRVGKVNELTENEENLGSASTSASSEETIEVAPARARPQRVNCVQTRYVLSDSESDHATEDSEFDEVTDESEDE